MVLLDNPYTIHEITLVIRALFAEDNTIAERGFKESTIALVASGVTEWAFSIHTSILSGSRDR